MFAQQYRFDVGNIVHGTCYYDVLLRGWLTMGEADKRYRTCTGSVAIPGNATMPTSCGALGSIHFNMKSPNQLVEA